jgi:hypothetical protein
MTSSDDDLPTPFPRTRVTRSSVARDLSPTTAIPPFTPPPRRHVSRINANVTPQHGGTSAPGLATNYYDPINDDTLDDNPPEGVLPTSSQNSPSLLTSPSPGDVPNLDDPPPPGTLSPSTMTAVFQEGFATAPAVPTVFPAGFLAPTDFGTAASVHTTATPDMVNPPSPSTDLEKILAAIGGINTRFDHQHAEINARFDGVTARFDALGDRLQSFESLGPRIDALDERVRTTGERVTTTDGVVTARFVALGDRLQTFESLGPRIDALDAQVRTTVERVTTTDGALRDMDARITTAADLFTTATTRLDDELIDYSGRLLGYGSRLGHFTNTVIPRLRSDLDAFATRITTIEGRPPTDASPTASVASAADDVVAADPLQPPDVDDDASLHASGRPPYIEDVHLSPTERSRMAWAAAQTTRATGGHPVDERHASPPSYRDHRPNPIQHPDHPVDARDTPYDLSSVGPLESPRLGDREHRARQLGVSRFDILGLAHSTYHAGADGFPTLTSGVLSKIGYNKISSSDVVSCHNDIIAVHRRILELWHNPVSHTFGPQVDRIITKSLKLLPSLTSLMTENVVDFYDRLQESTTGLIIAIMPFDAIMLTNRFEGLCVPALGVRRYQLMSRALMELLPRLVPGTLSPQINAALSSVRYESNNGYDYLWRVLELTVPGFDPVVPIHIPSWSNADDVFSFAQSYLLYFRLQSKQNFHYDDRTRSGIFLRAIQFSDFADTVTTLQSHVNSFREQYDDGYLPPHLRIHGLATSINQNTQARMRDVISPRVRRLSTMVQGLPTIHRVDRDDRQRVGFKERDGGGKFDREYGPVDAPMPHVPHGTANALRLILAAWPVQTATVDLSFQMSNVRHANEWATWRNTATCLPRPFA